MILRTSNKFKIEDYKLINIKDLNIIKNNNPIQEVLGTMDEIIIYKTLDATLNELVEDSILIIDNKEWIDIKNTMCDVPENKKVEYVVSIGYHLNDRIEIYRGITQGIIIKNNIKKGESYDINSIFIPNGYTTTLNNIKDFYTLTPRYKALQKLLLKNPENVILKSEITPWKGDYQKS